MNSMELCGHITMDILQIISVNYKEVGDSNLSMP